jgi:hypothetical protein
MRLAKKGSPSYSSLPDEHALFFSVLILNFVIQGRVDQAESNEILLAEILDSAYSARRIYGKSLVNAGTEAYCEYVNRAGRVRRCGRLPSRVLHYYLWR